LSRDVVIPKLEWIDERYRICENLRRFDWFLRR
jgi:hypothetical protein